MKAEKTSPQRRPKRIVLPFEKQHTDAGSWAYEHRVGLCVTVIAYLLMGIVFMSAKILVGGEVTRDAIVIDLRDIPEPPKPLLTEEERKQIQEDFSNVRNRVSDENAKTDAGSTPDRSKMAQQIAAEAEAVSDKMRASREMYERGLREEQALIDARRSQSQPSDKKDKAESTKQKGRVTVSYSLPGRTATYLHIPAYQCEGGGEVVVEITVNRNGRVTSASLSRESAVREGCMADMALQAARITTFNVDGAASDRQNGTITYLFIPQ